MLEVAGVVCPAAGILVVVKDATPAMGNAVQCLPAVEAFTELFLNQNGVHRWRDIHFGRVLLTSTNSSGMPIPMKPEKSTVLGLLLLLPPVLKRPLLLFLLLLFISWGSTQSMRIRRARRV